MSRVANALQVFTLCVAAAVCYGVLHDLVTAHVCVEYFTIGHPMLIPTGNPVLLALLWGILATWWVGAFLGFWLAVAATVSSTPAARLVRPVQRLLVALGAAALLTGTGTMIAARMGLIWLVSPLADLVPGAAHTRFLFDGGAHLASYAAGFLGGLIVTVRTWRGKYR
ncbi:MAG: hypothetical protein AB1758_23020 [Candidatus Eremiobacterota bacterium]